MDQYLFLQSRSPFDSVAARHDYQRAADLAQQGHHVRLFLVQNGVLPARTSVEHSPWNQLKEAGVNVMADEFSLQERGITETAPDIETSTLDVVIDALCRECKVIWL